MSQSLIEGDFQNAQGMAIPTLPIAPHWQMLEAILRPIAYYRRCFLRNSGVVRVKMSPTLPPQQVLISDPSVIKELINEDGGRCISAPGELNGLLSQVLGKHSIILLAPATHRERRKLLTPPFHGERLKAYGQLISALAKKALMDRNVGDVFDAREQMQGITMRVILTAVFGLHEGDAFRRIERSLASSISIRSSPLGSLLLFFPFLRKDLGRWSPGRRIKAADATIRQLLLAQIASRRKAVERDSAENLSPDILSLLLSCKDDEGQGLSDDELHDELLTLLFAGHETTATALTWALYWIHRNPLVLERLMDELNGLRDHSDPEAITRLPYLSAVVNEVLRIHPVAMLTFPRRIEAPITLGGYAFHTGDVVLACIQAVHERPDLYPKPTQFIPERFMGRTYGLHEFLAFGGGSRRCIGAALALYEMKLILAELLRNNQFKLTPNSNRENKPRRRGFTLGPSIPVRLEILS
ncbi:cytochrome P450 [Synechococcus sp. Cu2B8-bc1011]|uniref:cytochrome P450 n=2 Tax=unclassified Synechococcus TaxID=2626047 RepID=UPI0039AECDE9